MKVQKKEQIRKGKNQINMEMKVIRFLKKSVTISDLKNKN